MTFPPRDLPVTVAVTLHARERARERFPGFKTARIVDEVRTALRAGRVSSRKPPTVKGASHSSCLYVWNDLRVYAVKAKYDVLLVTTVYVPGEGFDR